MESRCAFVSRSKSWLNTALITFLNSGFFFTVRETVSVLDLPWKSTLFYNSVADQVTHHIQNVSFTFDSFIHIQYSQYPPTWSSKTFSWKVYCPGTTLTRCMTGCLHVSPTTSPAAGDASRRLHSHLVICVGAFSEIFLTNQNKVSP